MDLRRSNASIVIGRKVILMVLFSLPVAQLTFAQDESWKKYIEAGQEALHQNRLDDAEQNYETALREIEKAGLRDSRLGDSLGNLALVYGLRKKNAKAENMYMQAVEAYERIGNAEDKIALTLWNLGKHYMAADESDKVDPTLSRALTLAEKAKGPENLLVAGILRSIAAARSKQKKYVEAEAAYRRALPIYEKSLGPQHWTVAATLEEFAVLLRKVKRKSDASEMEERAKRIRASVKKSEPYVIP